MSRTVPRDPRVWLPADVTRCEPSPQPPCERATCARYLSPIPARGGILADFAAERRATGQTGACMHHLSAEEAIAAGPPVPPRRVLPPIGSGAED